MFLRHWHPQVAGNAKKSIVPTNPRVGGISLGFTFDSLDLNINRRGFQVSAGPLGGSGGDAACWWLVSIRMATKWTFLLPPTDRPTDRPTN